VIIVPNIKPVSDLRNYNTVLNECVNGEPVYLTKNGRGRYVIMSIDDYERDRFEKRLFELINEAEERIKNGERCFTHEEVKEELRKRSESIKL
jgi:prevent-host-death family protein